MSIGSSFVFRDGGTTGGTDLTLPLINQDGYGSEYFKDLGTYTMRLQIRNSKDKVKAGSQSFDRHTLTVTKFIKPTSTLLLGSTSQVTFTVRNDPSQAFTEVEKTADGVAFAFKDNNHFILRLLGWES